ncbi:MAG: hypothetical protein KDN22_05520 [Verrucomicrobiae bacterium]|nr:hypothetical protein [Verrucomicrobiae bacterium]
MKTDDEILLQAVRSRDLSALEGRPLEAEASAMLSEISHRRNLIRRAKGRLGSKDYIRWGIASFALAGLLWTDVLPALDFTACIAVVLIGYFQQRVELANRRIDAILVLMEQSEELRIARNHTAQPESDVQAPSGR